jgi:hypothetical protein
VSGRLDEDGRNGLTQGEALRYWENEFDIITSNAVIQIMRTTLDIDDSILAAAKEMAGVTRSSAGAIISEWARNGLSHASTQSARSKSGFPAFAVASSVKPLTSVTVKAILADEGLSARR